MNIINYLDNLAIPLTRIKEVSMSDIETKIEKPNRPLNRNRFIVETEEFLASFLKAKNIVIPDASQPVDVDKFLLSYDVEVAND